MSTRRVSSNLSVIYVIAFIAVIIAFFLLGGLPWIQSLGHNNSIGIFNHHEYHHMYQSRLGIADWNWTQILISFGLGLLIGSLVTRRR
jgi:hypothetical protein